MVPENAGYQLVQGIVEMVGIFQNVRELAQLFRHDGIQNGVGVGDGLG